MNKEHAPYIQRSVATRVQDISRKVRLMRILLLDNLKSVFLSAFGRSSLISSSGNVSDGSLERGRR
jgi:hypothetical protein